MQLIEAIPTIMHEKPAARFEKLPAEEINNITQLLDTIVYLSDIDTLEASPLLTFKDQLDKQLNNG